MIPFNSLKEEFRENWKLGFPIMLGQAGQVIVNVVDNLMVGSLGSKHLAAISLGVTTCIVFIIVGLGISFALPPVLAKADGEGKTEKIGSYFYHSGIINIVYAALCFLIILLLIPLLPYIGHEAEVVAWAIPYIELTAVAMFPLMIFQTLRCFSDGLSFTRLAMIAILMGNVLNIGLNYILIFGHLGFDPLGVKGAALATLASRCFMIIILLILIYREKKLIQFISQGLGKVQKAIFGHLLNLGIPTSLQMFFEVSGFAAAALMMGMISADAQAGHQIAINLSSITFLICTGLGMASTVRVGNRFGQKDYLKMQYAGIGGIVQVIIIMLIFAILFVIFRNFLPSVYIDNTTVETIASTLLIAAAIFQIPDGVQVVAIGALRGLQDVTIPTLITFLSYWVLGLPASYICAFLMDMGPLGIWMGLVVGLSVSSVLLSWRFSYMSKYLQSPQL